jgi:hypothetical protein
LRSEEIWNRLLRLSEKSSRLTAFINSSKPKDFTKSLVIDANANSERQSAGVARCGGEDFNSPTAL